MCEMGNENMKWEVGKWETNYQMGNGSVKYKVWSIRCKNQKTLIYERLMLSVLEQPLKSETAQKPQKN